MRSFAILVWTFTFAVFCTANADQNVQQIFDKIFLIKPSERCPAAEMSPVIYNECKNPACGQVKVGTNTIRTNTGDYTSSDCGFKVAGWDLALCRQKVSTLTESASCPGSASKGFPKRCRHDVDCVVPVMDAATCRIEACGIEASPKPVSYKPCSSFWHGIDRAYFKEMWNSSGPEARSYLEMILLLDENRNVTSAESVDKILVWLAHADLVSASGKQKLNKLVGVLETSPGSLSPSAVDQIVGG